MITYYLRPDGTQVKIDSDNQTVSNIVNKNDQKITRRNRKLQRSRMPPKQSKTNKQNSLQKQL